MLPVQPPTAILEHMHTVRLHLDPRGEENGALRVLPGSYTRGKIPEDEQIPAHRMSLPEEVCAVGLGGALLIRPLLLNASSPARVPAHRRIVHLDLASVAFPELRSSGSLRPPSLSWKACAALQRKKK